MQSLAAAQYGLAPALASALLHSLWQNALLAVAAALALRAMAHSSAAARHNVAMAFLVAMALVPAIQFARFWDQSGAQINDGLIPAMSAPMLAPATGIFVQESSPIAAVIVLLWLAGAVLMLVRHVAALRLLAAMDRGPHQQLPAHWRARVEHIRQAMGIARGVAVRVSEEVVAPFAARLVRPVVWLPMSLLMRAPADQIDALLAHELAHIARKDWLWNGVQCAIEALLFFNPAVWWLGRRVRQEREHACDDLAVAACGDALALAEALTALECDRHPSPRLALAAQGGSLMKRVTRLLTVPPSRGRWPAVAVLGTLTVSLLLLAAQVGLAGGHLPDLEVRSSTAGVLGPGDYREITASGIDKRRYYRAEVDAQGRLQQVYKVDGEPRPIDADAARWIDRVSRMTVPSAADYAKVHAEALARVHDTPEMNALFAMIAAHPAVVARLGAPAAPTARQVEGNIEIVDRADGEADITIELRGPNGTAAFDVDAKLRNRIWNLNSLTAA